MSANDPTELPIWEAAKEVVLYRRSWVKSPKHCSEQSCVPVAGLWFSASLP